VPTHLIPVLYIFSINKMALTQRIDINKPSSIKHSAGFMNIDAIKTIIKLIPNILLFKFTFEFIDFY